jgi:hypothetical protein
MKINFLNVRSLKKIIILVAFLIFACSKDNNTDDSAKTVDGWTVETVENNVSVANGKISVAIDQQNNIHICYYDNGIRTNGSLKYATNKSGKWSVSRIDEDDTDAIKGEWNDITVDKNGTVHVVYTVHDNEDDNENFEAIRYAKHTNTGWYKEDVFPTAINVSEYQRCCIASDDNGTIHIAAAVFGNNYTIDYTSNATSSWVRETAGTFRNFSTDVSMAVDGLNRPHIAYTDYDGYHLRTVTRLGLNDWNSRLISGNANFPNLSDQNVAYPSIAVSDSGKEYILYHNTMDDNIWFYNNGSLNSLAYDVGGGGFCMPVILCDKAGYLHYLYGMLNNSEWVLFYGRNTSGSFIYDQIFGFRATSNNSDLAVSSDNVVYIVYGKTNANSLNIAYKKY